MVIDEEIEIHAPLDVVWRIFSQMEDWDQWNTACRECCILEGDSMNSGTCFSFKIKPWFLPLRVAPRIVECEPGKTVTWEGGRLGVNAAHTWRFREQDGKVILRSVERFRGPLLIVGRVLGIPQKLHRLTREFLETLKKAAENCGNPGHAA
jgi:hypothetical protein